MQMSDYASGPEWPVLSKVVTNCQYSRQRGACIATFKPTGIDSKDWNYLIAAGLIFFEGQAGRCQPVKALQGKRVLVAEDETLLAMMLQEMFEEIGVIVVGPAYSQAQALAAVEVCEIDGALLDVNLGDGLSFPVAKKLTERGIPCCFGTGYGTVGISDEFGDSPVLQKPYRFEDLVTCLAGLFEKKQPIIRGRAAGSRLDNAE